MAAKNVNAPRQSMVCQCCYMTVRYSMTADAWFHVNGNPETETIAREITPDNGVMTPMKAVIPDVTTAVAFSYPTQEQKDKRIRQINNIRIVSGRV